MEITVLKEEARGCGYRHSGKDGVGLYLMGDGIWEPCERIPFPLGFCPSCGEGIKFSRGFTWIDPSKLFSPILDPKCDLLLPTNAFNDSLLFAMGKHQHQTCAMCSPPSGRHGLLWIGEKFYSPGGFMAEAMTRGISKRIATFPKGFKIGETVVYLAHKKAVRGDEKGKETPGVITVFKPDRLELVVDTTNPEELPSRAITLKDKLGDKARIVKVERVAEQLNLLEEAE